MSQLDLITGEPVDVEPERGGGVTLTERQALALRFIGQHQPVSSDELGAVLHEDRMRRGGKGHDASERCERCSSEGAQMGDALRKRGHVVRKRTVGWCLTGYRPVPAGTGSGIDPKTSDWPEGF